MRTEFKKITVEREVYIADDGTEFEDEDDCQGYEFNLKLKKFTMYGQKLNETDSLDYATYVYLGTKELVDEYAALCKYYGITFLGLNEPGLYMYTEWMGCRWSNITDVVEKFKDIV